MRIRFGRNCDMTPVMTPVIANHARVSRSTAFMNVRIAVRKSTVQIASDDWVDAYTVLNENAPSSSAASAAVRSSIQRRASAKSSIGVVALSTTCTSSGIHGRSPNRR